MEHNLAGSRSSDARMGLQLGSFRLIRALSESYFGPRMLAHRAEGSALYVVRLIDCHDSDLLQRLARAADWARAVHHPLAECKNVVVARQHALGIATAFRDGCTVRALLELACARGESLPSDIAARIALDALDALETVEWTALRSQPAAELYGGVHPDSLLVGADGKTRLLDVGVASAACAEPRYSESTARLAYVAPEQASLHQTLGAESDVFSMGAILWEMLACRPLFVEDDPHALREQVSSAPIPRVFRDRFVRGEPIAAALAELIARCLRRDPGQRFGSYRELTEALLSSGSIADHAGVADHIAHLVGEASGAAGGRAQTSMIVAARAADSLAAPACPGGARNSARPPRPSQVAQEDQARSLPAAPEEQVGSKRRWPWLAAVALVLLLVGAAHFLAT